MNLFARLALFVAVAVTTVWSFLIPDAESFRVPELARIFFWHFPCTIVLTIFLIQGAYASIRYLKTKERIWDVRTAAAQEIALLFGVLVMTTGILFSRVQWGEWWQRDPRQTSFLLVLTIQIAYFAVRSGFSDPDRKATISAAYGASATLPIFFLIVVFPRLPQVARSSFHPTNTITGGLLGPDYRGVVIAMIVVMIGLSLWIYRLRVRAGELEIVLEAKRGELENHCGDSAAPRVVRPVRVPDEG